MGVVAHASVRGGCEYVRARSRASQLSGVESFRNPRFGKLVNRSRPASGSKLLEAELLRGPSITGSQIGSPTQLRFASKQKRNDPESMRFCLARGGSVKSLSPCDREAIGASLDATGKLKLGQHATKRLVTYARQKGQVALSQASGKALASGGR